MSEEQSKLRQLQLIELDILKQVVAICEAHSLRYFLMGGTFLGAVRHQGFIPWDDDIDIGLPRADFEKFCAVAPKELKDGFGLESWHTNAEHIRFNPKVYHYGSKVIDHSGVTDKETYAWIDIFPLDGMPNNGLLRKLYGWRLLFLRFLLMYSQFDKAVSVNTKNRVWYEQILVSVGKKVKFDKVLNTGKIMVKLENTLKSKDYDKCTYVGNFMGAYRMKEVFPKKYYEEVALYPFEGLQLPAPKDYDTVLRQMYGDYKTPPKKEEQNKHFTEVI